MNACVMDRSGGLAKAWLRPWAGIAGHSGVCYERFVRCLAIREPADQVLDFREAFSIASRPRRQTAPDQIAGGLLEREAAFHGWEEGPACLASTLQRRRRCAHHVLRAVVSLVLASLFLCVTGSDICSR